MTIKQQHCLVTGANGFIGNALHQRLMAYGCQIRTITRQPLVNCQDNRVLDLKSANFPSDLCQGIDTIFHLAGKAHALAETRQDALEYQATNVDATRKLLENAQQAGVKRFIYFSSIKAIGGNPENPQNETAIEVADTPYGESKFQAEQLVLHGGYVAHPVVIRPCMVYGNSDKGNLPKMIKAVKRGIFPPISENHKKRSMVHVDDLIQAAILSAENPVAATQIYIVSDGHDYTTRQIYNWIRETLQQPPIHWSIPSDLLHGVAKIGDLIGHFRNKRFLFDSDALEKLTVAASYSSAKIQNQLGFRPQITLAQALPDIIRYLNLN